jgi:glycosyltransferase involved in cell wall biosynthesis
MPLPPEISVVVATHNMGRFLPNALDSLLAQSLPQHKFEIIVVDDGSTDSTKEVLSRFASRVRILRHPRRRGLVPSVNRGLQQARGRYLVRVDADDEAAPDLLYLGSRWLRANPRAACVVSDRIELRQGRRVRKKVDPENPYSLIACGSVFPTRLLRNIGHYRQLYWEEYDLYLRLREQGEFLYLPLPRYFYRKHARSMTHNQEQRKSGWRELLDCWGAETLRNAGFNPELEAVLREAAIQ